MYFFLCIIIGLFIYFLYRKCNQLNDRILRLEKQLCPQDRPAEVLDSTQLSEMAPTEAVTRVLEQEQGSVEVFFRWLSVDWPMKLGAILILLGFGWLTTYAFLNNWIGPIGRITFGMAGGIGILLFGNRRLNKYRAQGAVLMGLGAGVFLLTIFAAREVYNFFTPTAALVMIALIAVFVGFASWKHNNLSLGVIGLLAGGVAPLLTNTVHPSFVGLFSYIFIISIAIIWLASVKGWRVLIFLSLILAFFYSTPYFMAGVLKADMAMAMLFACLFGMLFYGVGLSTMAFSKEGRIMDIFTAAINAFFILLWIVTVIPDHLQSLVATGIALVFAIGAFSLFHNSTVRNLFYVYAAVAAGMIIAATAFELSGPAFIIAYTVEVGLIALVTAYVVLDNYRLGAYTGLLLGVSVLSSIGSIFSYEWVHGIFHDDFFVLFTLALTLLLLAFFFNSARKRFDQSLSLWVVRPFFGLGSIYVFILMWLSIHAVLINDTTARMITLIIYTVFGIVFYFMGINKKLRGVQFEGEVLFGFVVLDLLFIEIWHMDLVGKVFTFLLIGSLLISTIFLRKENKKEDTIIIS
ncbi:MAG: DUF2339 domain-containing protein [bacterium]